MTRGDASRYSEPLPSLNRAMILPPGLEPSSEPAKLNKLKEHLSRGRTLDLLSRALGHPGLTVVLRLPLGNLMHKIILNPSLLRARSSLRTWLFFRVLEEAFTQVLGNPSRDGSSLSYCYLEILLIFEAILSLIRVVGCQVELRLFLIDLRVCDYGRVFNNLQCFIEELRRAIDICTSVPRRLNDVGVFIELDSEVFDAFWGGIRDLIVSQADVGMDNLADSVETDMERWPFAKLSQMRGCRLSLSLKGMHRPLEYFESSFQAIQMLERCLLGRFPFSMFAALLTSVFNFEWLRTSLILGIISACVDSRLESIEQFLDNFANHPNETDMNDLEYDDKSVDTPLVSPFPHSDNDSDNGEVLNELIEYENVGMLRHEKAINNFDGDDLAFQCMIGFRKFVAYFDPFLPINIITRKAYNTIMVEELESIGKNLVAIVRDVYVFVGSFTYITDFVVLEDIGEFILIDKVEVVMGKPFRKITKLEYDCAKGLMSFNRIFNNYTFQMPRTILRFKRWGHVSWSKIPRILMLSQRDLNRFKNAYEKNKFMYNNCLNLGPDQVDVIFDEKKLESS
ncbi:hypothetical protein Tco_0719020 [Tanacetum coccineum]